MGRWSPFGDATSDAGDAVCDVCDDGGDGSAFVSVDGLLARVVLGGFAPGVKWRFGGLVRPVTSSFVLLAPNVFDRNVSE